MQSGDLIKRVRKIEIRTKRLSREIFAGEYHSAFKGRGMAFSEVREYQYGDDLRSMDWNVTAKLNTPYVKVFEEERELTVILMIDVSASRLFGSTLRTKQELATEIAAIVSFSAAANNDNVGALFFSDRIEKFIPPKKGRSHLLRIISELLDFKPEGKGTNLTVALQFLTNAIKRRSTAFLLSDMLDVDEQGNPNFSHALRIASSRHELFVIKIYDQLERTIPNVGLIRVADSETGERSWVDSSNRRVRESYIKWNEKGERGVKELLAKYNIEGVSIATHSDYVKQLMLLFKNL
ncbi:MAG: DUF58 domain-containing protein [Bacteroidales bacterium]